MALNNTTADALATAICSALGVSDSATIEKYKSVYRLVYAALKTDAVVTATVTVTSVTGVTVGAAASGPGAGTATGALT